MTGVFQLQDNRQKCRKQFNDTNIKLTLFAPDYTDDESDDHDNSEDESEDEGDSESQNSEEENQIQSD